VGESLPGEHSQTRAHVIGRSDEKRAQLVEAGVPRLQRPAALEQEQAQVLASSTAAGKAQPFAAEQPPRSQSRVDQIALAASALLTARTLALVDADPGTLESFTLATCERCGKETRYDAGRHYREDEEALRTEWAMFFPATVMPVWQHPPRSGGKLVCRDCLTAAEMTQLSETRLALQAEEARSPF